jgi:hypothetical protein
MLMSTMRLPLLSTVEFANVDFVSCASSHVQEKRVEVLELQALLEAERVSQTNPDKRGNSIFSEVEDRRQQVERQLAKLTTLLDREKKKSIDLQAEIVKVRVGGIGRCHFGSCLFAPSSSLLDQIDFSNFISR